MYFQQGHLSIQSGPRLAETFRCSVPRFANRNPEFWHVPDHVRPSTAFHPHCGSLDEQGPAAPDVDHRLSLHCSIEEIRVYQKHFEGRRMRFTDGQRRRFGVKAKALGRKALMFHSFAEMIRRHYDVAPELTVVDFPPSNVAVSDVLKSLERPLVAGVTQL